MSLIRTEIQPIPYILMLHRMKANNKEVTKMKRNYEEPEMEVLLLEFADVMNQSTPTTEENELGPDFE